MKTIDRLVTKVGPGIPFSAAPPGLASSQANGPAWPTGLHCDVINIPVEAACGLISHLLDRGVTVCPIAQVGDRLMALAAAGSVGSCEDSRDLPPGVLLAELVNDFPAVEPSASMGACWVVPLEAADAPLPNAQDILTALQSAYAEHVERRPAERLRLSAT